MLPCAQVFPLRHLECFYEDEIERLLCGEGETWCALSATKAHGCSFTIPRMSAFGAKLAPNMPPKPCRPLGIAAWLLDRR